MFIMAILGGALIWRHGKQAVWGRRYQAVSIRRSIPNGPPGTVIPRAGQ